MICHRKPEYRLTNLIIENIEAFNKPGTKIKATNLYKHRITLKKDATNWKVYRNRHINPKNQAEIDSQLQKLVSQGAIEPVTPGESIDFISPCILIKKSDGISFRMVIDLRFLNSRLSNTEFNQKVATFNEILAILGSTNFKKLSVLDISSAYYAIPLTEDSKNISYLPLDGYYRHVSLPMGLKNSASVFSNVMLKMLGHLRTNHGRHHYLDDLIVVASSETEMLTRLEQLFKRIIAANLELSAKKAIFFGKSVKFLGHEFNTDREVKPIDHR